MIMLAKPWNEKESLEWHWVSEKLDGMRALWLPGTVGVLPWWGSLNVGMVREQRLTGLWSRQLKPIQAPDWWLRKLPDYPLDGELWMGRGRFQDVMSTCRGFGGDWSEVTYVAFDRPGAPFTEGVMGFERTLRELQNNVVSNDVVRVHHFDRGVDVTSKLLEVLAEGGEGLMARNGDPWVGRRSGSLLKVKGCLDSEGICVGYTPGRGKYEGMIGALELMWNGKNFLLSGMTDIQRVLPTDFVGKTISFKYRELTRDGIPKEARFWRTL